MGEEANHHLATTSFQVVLKDDEDPLFFQDKHPHVPQPSLIWFTIYILQKVGSY